MGGRTSSQAGYFLRRTTIVARLCSLFWTDFFFAHAGPLPPECPQSFKFVARHGSRTGQQHCPDAGFQHLCIGSFTRGPVGEATTLRDSHNQLEHLGPCGIPEVRPKPRQSPSSKPRKGGAKAVSDRKSTRPRKTRTEPIKPAQRSHWSEHPEPIRGVLAWLAASALSNYAIGSWLRPA
jgi:hypothetical protein